MGIEELRTQMIKAAQNGDDVRMVTIALQIAASKARGGDRTSAMAIRQMVDDWKRRNSAISQWRNTRLSIAAQILSGDSDATAAEAVRLAETLMRANVETPVDMGEDANS